LIDSINLRPWSKIERCFVCNEQLIISDTNWDELSFYDLSNPAAPEFIKRYSWNLITNDLLIEDGYLYTLNTYYGLNILDLNQVLDVEDSIQIPATIYNLRNYPNPFNPETTISFEISKPGDVILDVFNLKGQLIKRLINNQMTTGKHNVIWDGKDNNGKICSSGVYYYRIESNGITETKKMVLMK
jgi:hypothetical protein